ncbi:hypothetical protein ThimaDRAFT_3023 [Thiocapsa marina 5811]|uniref:Uncharacterized protein n=1 Tax=Thiocapsa marina 5811 TaxID=768671 RepID=F9UDS1_9GAMM|nr:hypothetical protein ThimaDRAFT_3023 [Thiocapsa marina 5811]
MHPTDMSEATENPSEPRLDWHLIQMRDASDIWCTKRDTTQIAAVEGGWLFRFHHYDGSQSAMSTQALTFVPDPEHRWSPEQTKPHHTGSVWAAPSPWATTTAPPAWRCPAAGSI